MGVVKGKRLNDANIVGEEQGQTTYATEKVVFIEGSLISIAVDGTSDPTELRVTIACSLGYYSSAPSRDTSSGSAGVSALVARGDHYHPGVEYNVQTGVAFGSGYSFSTGVTTPRALLCLYASSSGIACSSLGFALNGGVYGCIEWLSGGSAAHPNVQSSRIAYNGDGTYWNITSWTPNIAGNRVTGTSAGAANFIVIGD